MPTKVKAKAASVEELIAEDPAEAGSDAEFEFDDSADYSGDGESDSPEPEQPVRLVGPELLAFYNEQKVLGRTHAEIAFDAGYYTVTKNGQERVMQAQFNEAFLEAQGIETGGRSSGTGRSHAGLSRARVSGQGILLVSQLATRNVGAEPGAVFEVSYPGDGQILLSPTGEVKPVVPRKKGQQEEEPGTPLFDAA